jgi:hypothetical protein
MELKCTKCGNEEVFYLKNYWFHETIVNGKGMPGEGDRGSDHEIKTKWVCTCGNVVKEENE